MALGLPLLVVDEFQRHRWFHAPLMQVMAVFLLATLAAQLGLIVRRWGNIRVSALFSNLVLSAVAAGAYWVVVMAAVRRGGGAVDPTIVALFTSYLLAVWSGHPA